MFIYSFGKIGEHAQHNDAILLVVVPASQASEISSSRALKIAKEYDSDSEYIKIFIIETLHFIFEVLRLPFTIFGLNHWIFKNVLNKKYSHISLFIGTRTVGIISKIDQAAENPKALAAVQALLSNQGPPKTTDIPWVALIGQSVAIASAQSGGSENSLETAWRAESESLKSILTGAPQSKLGRIALVDTLASQIRSRMKLRLPNILSGYFSVHMFALRCHICK